MDLLAQKSIRVELENSYYRNLDAPTRGSHTRPFAVVGSRHKPFDEYAVVQMAQPGGFDMEIGKAVHKALQQLSNGLPTVARVAVELVTWMVEGSDSRLDVVPVFRLGVLTDDCLAALAKAGDVVGRCHSGPLRCLDDHVN
jgi:hypothetical protein